MYNYVKCNDFSEIFYTMACIYILSNIVLYKVVLADILEVLFSFLLHMYNVATHC